MLAGTGRGHAQPGGALPGVGAVMGMGDGSGLGVPPGVLRVVSGSRLQPLTGQADDGSKEVPGFTPKLSLRPKFKEGLGYPLSGPGQFKMTYYWLAYEAEYAAEPYDVDIYTKHGFLIGRFPRVFVFELKMEGSGMLRDGRVLNYDGPCSYGIGICFQTVDLKEHPMGKGGQQRALVPFVSVAVDPRFVPLGTTLYLPELAGLQLPDGRTHDGCVRADDTGGNIRRRELDFFVESYAIYKHLEELLWNDHSVTPHIEEPRCAYLRARDEVLNRRSETTDWVTVHKTRPKPAGNAGGKGSHKRGKRSHK